MYCINGLGKWLLLVVAIAATNNAFAQSYYNTPNDTIKANAVFDDVGVYNIIQKHTAADTIYFYWSLQSAVMPPSWVASLCVNNACYDTLTVSGGMGPIVTGDDGLMSLHVNPGREAGVGVVRYSLYASNSAALVDTLTWIITASDPNRLYQMEKEAPVVKVINNILTAEALSADYTTAALYNMDGRLLHTTAITDGKLLIALTDNMPRHMLLQLSGRRQFITRIFNY